MADFRLSCPACKVGYDLPEEFREGVANKILTCDGCQGTWVPFPATGFMKKAPEPLPIDLGPYRAEAASLFGSELGGIASAPAPDRPTVRAETPAAPAAPTPATAAPRALRVLASGAGVDVRGNFDLAGHSFLIGDRGCHVNVPGQQLPARAIRIRSGSAGFSVEPLGGYQIPGIPAGGPIPPISAGRNLAFKIGGCMILLEASTAPGSPIPDLEGTAVNRQPAAAPAPAAPSSSPAFPPPPSGGASVAPAGADSGGTVLDLMASGMGAATRADPLEGLEAGFAGLEGPFKGKGFRITKTPILVGRTSGDMKIPDPRVSGKHAQLDVLDRNNFQLKDLASTNGTRVNERPISTARLSTGDVVSFGGVKFRFIVRART